MNPLERRWIAAAAALGFLLVMLGAFGAHGLQRVLTEENPKGLERWELGIRYGFWHALAVGLVGLLAARAPSSRSLDVAGASFALGIVLFSGSLLLMGVTQVTKLGMITPFGGLAFLVGWGALFVHALRAKGAAP